mgnify:CR=1 FL=1
MRKINKYKIYKVSGICLKKFPLRILKFRRPKWNNLQKLLKNNLITSRSFKQNKSFFGKKKIKSSLFKFNNVTPLRLAVINNNIEVITINNLDNTFFFFRYLV